MLEVLQLTKRRKIRRKETPMIQYIASDLDGTLLPDGGDCIDSEIFDLILKLKERGIRFIAASGFEMRFLTLQKMVLSAFITDR